MFGYVVPDKMNMFMKDFYSYRGFYCGLCKSIGRRCGQLMRIGTTYDMTFLNVLAHAVLDVEMQMKMGTCVLNRVQRKLIGTDDEITLKVVDISTILAHYKCVDDYRDEKSASKRFADASVIRRHYKKAKKLYPELDAFISQKYAELAALEGEKCASPDRAAHPFAEIMVKIGETVFGEKNDETLEKMMYNVGKWVYICDAIDDVDDDFKKKGYNVFLQNYEYKDKAAFLQEKKQTLEYVLMSAYNAVLESFDKIQVKKYEGILTNVIWYGMLNNTNELLRRCEKCKKIRI
ncbi:MAG: DUF5685 family protein [Clostridia bacterium]|nr:DUF5685 family protein [Clostridia bacterium]